MARVKFGQIGRLKSECIEVYRQLHEVSVHTPEWQGVIEMIRACHMDNYAIFIKDDLVFGYFEYVGDDYEADMKKMAADPLTNAWWAHTRPCFTKLNVDSAEAFYEDMVQIFDMNL